jgi:hypothetical protein
MTTRISALPSLAAVTDATIIPVVEGGATKRITGLAQKTYTGTAAGPQGPSGPSGPSGANGSAGSAGVTGPQGPTGPVAGSNTQIIYNNNGSAAGSANLTYSSGTFSVIGTTASAYYANADAGYAFLDGATNSSGARINIGGGTTAQGIFFWGYNSARNAYTPLNFGASSHIFGVGSSTQAEAMRINSTGTVFINCTTTTPPSNTNIKFNTAGQVVFSQGTVTTGDVAKGMVNFLPHGCSTNGTNSEAWADLATGVFIDSQIENGNIALCNSALLIRGQVGGSGSPGALIRAGTGGNGSSSFTQQFRVLYNGNVTNTNNSYGSLSDARAKQDITDAASQWNDIKAVRVRKYRLISDVERSVATGVAAPYQIGVVAQELQQTSPGLVEDNGDENNMMSVKNSVMYMKAIKALQEAMSRIENLETEVAALKAR